MPFLKGVAPIRYTKAYLEAGKLILQPEIRVMTINYNVNQKASSGIYKFQFWHLPQIKYKNHQLQILRFKNMTPTPFIQFFFINGEKQIIDVHGRTQEEIYDHIHNTFCEQPAVVKPYYEERKKDCLFNPANFGYHCRHWCICEIPGQVPCPGYSKLPDNMRAKKNKEMQEQEKAT
ncbi:probable 28S ribosomal protein S25, mitochondrial [Dreissena polymorpha]|uniref:Small ribosomal subunit protein mS25 n=1 Tax=Dreissena polymorpha TaxID=45954 RepID=A0A9D4GIJ8_DREPO|nr:probable 28S ribosomal protein S25, mitochondrial [Dreissena polymorpha]KAH3816116.1 hypothetical protein DPMN_117624 [Dreissena polymorpha]